MADKTYAIQPGEFLLCPVCQAQKTKSKVWRSGAEARTTKVPEPGYWDESGKFNPPPMVNTLTCSYFCSLGHKWSEQGACP